VLGLIHSVAVEGFWKRQADGSWDLPDWASVMESTLRDRDTERRFILQAGFGEEDCDEMMRLLHRYQDEFECPRPVFCHCDYLLEHILGDDDLRVSGVVDCGDFCGDHPIRDLAIVHEAEEMDLAAILRGYSADWVRGDQFEVRLYLHRLALDMGYLAYFMRERPHHPWITFHSRQLRATLGWLQTHGW
jgi:Ser/Thr protein kinase RdoA (MazF antagonist)